jgi:hypothetical protein
MQPNLIRHTLNMLEAVDMELVADRDFDLVHKAEKNGKEYALGNTVHDDGDSSKNDYQIYAKVRDGGFEWKDKFHPQEFFTQVATLDAGSYGSESEALEAFQKWIESN